MKKKLILTALLMSMAVPVFAEEELIWEEQAATEDVGYAESVFEEEETVEQTASEDPEYVFEEDVVTEETAGDESASSATAVAVEGLVYTGEPQALILPQPGSWTYSLDGEHFTDAIPTAINAGTYTVYLREGDTDPVVITVCIAKADVVFTPPVANTSSTIITTTENEQENEEPVTGEPGGDAVNEEPAYAAGEENEVGEGAAEPAYSGDEPAYADEVVFE